MLVQILLMMVDCKVLVLMMVVTSANYSLIGIGNISKPFFFLSGILNSNVTVTWIAL